jgi:hypothetical protein
VNPPDATSVIPVPAPDHQAVPAGAFVQAPLAVDPFAWIVGGPPPLPLGVQYVFIAFSVLEQMNKSSISLTFKYSIASHPTQYLGWRAGARRARELHRITCVCFAEDLLHRSPLEPTSAAWRRDGFWWRLGRPECVVWKYVAS